MNEKKGTFWCLFFAPIYVLAGLLYLPVAHADIAHDSKNRCPANHIDQLGKVRYVHDGDTIILKNGVKVRLIGINTAEVARKQKNNKTRNTTREAEPYANAAREHLRQLLPKGSNIQLQFGEDKKDRYGRTLAHVFTHAGENVQATLLQQGLASVIIFPPNDSLARCYLKIEQQARCQKLALWSQDNHILASQQVTTATKGFHLIQGKVTHIETNKQGIWIKLAGDLTLGIRPQNQHLFDTTYIASLTGKTLLTRGWLNKGKNNHPYIRIRHPLSMEVINKKSCLTN